MSNSLPWRQTVRRDVKTWHDDKRFVITLKSLSWHKKHIMTQNVCHDVKSLSWSQKYIMMSMTSKTCFHNILFPKWWKKMSGKRQVMTSKIRHDNKNFVMKYRTHHDVNKFVMMTKSSSWHQKSVACHQNFHDVKTFAITSKVLHTLWRQKGSHLKN